METEDITPTLEQSQEADTMFVRLVTGEDLITDIIWTEDNNFIFINPMKIVYLIGDDPGVLKLTLVQWVFSRISESQEFMVNGDDILTMAPISKELMKYYNETMNTKEITVETPKSNFDDDFDEADLVSSFTEQEKKKILH
jgi:type I restriction-modification system DNA methylase subunit